MKKDYGDIRVYLKKAGKWGLLVRHSGERDYYMTWNTDYSNREEAMKAREKWHNFFVKHGNGTKGW